MNIHINPRPALLLAISFSLLAVTATMTASAQTQGGGGQGQQGQQNHQDQGGTDHPHGPPPEAIAACTGKSSGGACNFVGRQGEQLTGTCFSPPAGGPSASQGGQQGAQSAPKKTGEQGTKPMACRPHRQGK